MKSFKERWQELSLKNKIFSIIIFLGVCVMIVLTVLPSKEKESVEDEIKRKNKELGLLTVMEVVSKDCIYLKNKKEWKGIPLGVSYGVVYEHKGVIEYVIDLSSPSNSVSVSEVGQCRQIEITIDEPHPDNRTCNVVIGDFRPVKRFGDWARSEEIVVRGEEAAKEILKRNLQEIAAQDDLKLQAREMANLALCAIYKAVDSSADIRIKFK